MFIDLSVVLTKDWEVRCIGDSLSPCIQWDNGTEIRYDVQILLSGQ